MTERRQLLLRRLALLGIYSPTRKHQVVLQRDQNKVAGSLAASRRASVRISLPLAALLLSQQPLARSLSRSPGNRWKHHCVSQRTTGAHTSSRRRRRPAVIVAFVASRRRRDRASRCNRLPPRSSPQQKLAANTSSAGKRLLHTLWGLELRRDIDFHHSTASISLSVSSLEAWSFFMYVDFFTNTNTNTTVISIVPPTVWPMAHYRSQLTRVSQP